MKQNPTVVIRLVDELPCGAWTADGNCNRPATVAYGTAGSRGQWQLTPICRTCALATNAVYSADLVTGDQVRAAYDQTGSAGACPLCDSSNVAKSPFDTPATLHCFECDTTWQAPDDDQDGAS